MSHFCNHISQVKMKGGRQKWERNAFWYETSYYGAPIHTLRTSLSESSDFGIFSRQYKQTSWTKPQHQATPTYPTQLIDWVWIEDWLSVEWWFILRGKERLKSDWFVSDSKLLSRRIYRQCTCSRDREKERQQNSRFCVMIFATLAVHFIQSLMIDPAIHNTHLPGETIDGEMKGSRDPNSTCLSRVTHHSRKPCHWQRDRSSSYLPEIDRIGFNWLDW